MTTPHELRSLHWCLIVKTAMLAARQSSASWLRDRRRHRSRLVASVLHGRSGPLGASVLQELASV